MEDPNHAPIARPCPRRLVPALVALTAIGLLLAGSSQAGDVTVKIDSGDGFAITDLAGTGEKIRVDEATANISRNGALFIHTTGNPGGGGLPPTTVSSNLYMGRNAGNVPSAFGAHTTAVGYEAHSNQHGWGNSAFGSRALKNASYTSRTSAFGAFAMESAGSTISDSSAFGYAALSSALTLSANNTAVGSRALVNGGSSNTAVGAGAMQNASAVISGASAFGSGAMANASSAASSSSAFGAGALANTQNNNSAFGSNSLGSNTTGANNSAFGETSMSYNVLGHNNSAFGRWALRANVNNSRNSAFGAFAMANDFFGSPGSDNVALGYRSLYQTTGWRNTAAGSDAMRYTTSGNDNVAFGHRAMLSNDDGFLNAAFGKDALMSLTSGYGNTAIGPAAMADNVDGQQNVAVGTAALENATSGNSNTVIGPFAARNQTTGSFNVAVGDQAALGNTGSNNVAIGRLSLAATTAASNVVAIGRYAGSVGPLGNDNVFIAHPGVAGESGTIRIGTSGTHTRAYVSGIFGQTVDSSTGTMVVVDSSGHLGTINSSARFKTDVVDMGERTEVLMKLRPVSFHYIEDGSSGEPVPQYGLIAEEVAAVAPDLVIRDEHGAPLTVKYHMLAPMLLNELQRMQRTLDARDATIEAQNRTLVELDEEVGRRLARLERDARSAAGSSGQTEPSRHQGAR
jgi:hypothetical protein